MKKISNEQLWGQVVSTAPVAADSLPQTRSDDPEPEKGGKQPLVPPKPNTPKPPVPKLKMKVEPSADVTMERAPANSPAIQVPKETALAEPKPEDFHLDQAEPLAPDSFPNPPGIGSTRIPATIPNIQYMFDRYGIKARYNVIKKAPEFVIPGLVSTVDNADNVAMAQIKSLARLNGMSVSGIEEAILAIADRNQYNPVANWIKSEPWDGINRLPNFYDTLTEHEDFPKEFKERLMYRWMISGVAAVFERQDFRARGVLTIQGKQGIGKTSWVSGLVTDIMLRENVIKLDHHMDTTDKDSMIAAATHWIIGLDELGSSFNKNSDRLKGFITNNFDKIRVPYAKTFSNFPRRTIFCGTVNDDKFLVDSTGNTRWWVIPVTKVNYQHNLDMQQVWAQVAVEYEQGAQWWLTPAEEQILESHNRNHRVVSVVEERVMPALDLTRKDEAGLPAMTPRELLMYVGYKYVTNPQSRECGALLREYLGEPKKINGSYKWRIPFATRNDFTRLDDDF